MKKVFIFFVGFIASFLLIQEPLFARSSGHHLSRHTSGAYHWRAVPGVARDSHGHIKRSAAARREFMTETGYPHGLKGYVVDHVVALKRGGGDSPSNMQWQTKEAAKAKDKVE